MFTRREHAAPHSALPVLRHGDGRPIVVRDPASSTWLDTNSSLEAHDLMGRRQPGWPARRALFSQRFSKRINECQKRLALADVDLPTSRDEARGDGHALRNADALGVPLLPASLSSPRNHGNFTVGMSFSQPISRLQH